MSFLYHAQSHGLIVAQVYADSAWHRTPTEDRPRSRNGAYIFDGRFGAVRNFRTMDSFAAFRDGSIERIDRVEMAARIRQARHEESLRHAAAAREAADLLKHSYLDVHPYLARKGFPAEKGLILENALLVPMRDFATGALWSVQRIAEDGTKRFLTGGRAKLATMTLGPRYVRERWLCEGYATGLSIRAALRNLRREAQVIICFSADNMRAVAPMVRLPAYVCADNDASDTGRRCAVATGLPWVMPPKGDANDLHQARGLRALALLLQSLELFQAPVTR